MPTKTTPSETTTRVGVANQKNADRLPATLSNLACSNTVANPDLSAQNAVAKQRAANGPGVSSRGKVVNKASGLGPLKARSTVDVLTNNELAQTIADLKAVIKSFPNRSPEVLSSASKVDLSSLREQGEMRLLLDDLFGALMVDDEFERYFRRPGVSPKNPIATGDPLAPVFICIPVKVDVVNLTPAQTKRMVADLKVLPFAEECSMITILAPLSGKSKCMRVTPPSTISNPGFSKLGRATGQSAQNVTVFQLAVSKKPQAALEKAIDILDKLQASVTKGTKEVLDSGELSQLLDRFKFLQADSQRVSNAIADATWKQYFKRLSVFHNRYENEIQEIQKLNARLSGDGTAASPYKVCRHGPLYVQAPITLGFTVPPSQMTIEELKVIFDVC